MADEGLIQIQAVGLFEAQRRLTAMQLAVAEAPRSIVHRASEILTRALQEAAPKRSGDMAESIAAEVGDSPVGATATWHASKVAGYVIRGTRAHDIWAGFYGGGGQGRMALHFVGSGGEVFSPYVRHPGTKPHDFRKEAWARVRLEVMAVLRESGRAVIRGSTVG